MDVVEFGKFQFQFHPPTLLQGANRVRLQPKALEVLRVLIERFPEIVTRAEILDEVWGLTATANDENMAAQIKAIRKHIGHECIETVPKVGYRFVAAPVRCQPRTESPPSRLIVRALDDVTPSRNTANERLREIFRRHGNLRFTERLLTSGIHSLSFREEWQFIVTRIVEDTRDCLRAMVFDRELTRWWNTVPGQLYMMANLMLLKSGGTIKRLFLIQSKDIRLIENAILNAYVHSQLGIDAKVCHVEQIAAYMPFQADMFSVHDDLMGVLYYLRRDEAVANILVDTKYIVEFVDFYDEIFSDDAISISVEKALTRYSPPKTFFARAANELGLVKRLSGITSIPELLSMQNEWRAE